MSRPDTAGQLTTKPSRDIFVTLIRQADGSLEPVVSSSALSDQSIRVNRTWQGEIWLGNEEITPGKYRKKYISARCTNSGALFLLRLLQSRENIYQNGKSQLLNYDLWGDIASWLLGVNLNLHHNEITLINHYAIATTPHSLVRHQKSGIFSRAEMDPAIVVIAAMRGQEDIVMNILRADPSYLLKTAKVKNSVDVEYDVTPLQAAIIANDVQLIERMKPYFERLTDSAGNPIDGLAEMKRQMIGIYKKSLRQYFDLAEEKIEKLNADVQTLTTEITALTQTISTLEKDKYQTSIDWNALKEAKETLITKNKALEAATEARSTTKINCARYLETLRSDIIDPHYLEKLVATHNQAQSDNTFDFEPYVDAICKIDPNDPELQDVLALIDAKTDAETQAAIAKGVSPIEIGFTDQYGITRTREEVQALPFDQLTLIQKLNRFREKLTAHMQQEIIFNPNHILESLRQNERIWDEVVARRVVDPNNYTKRAVIFSQLVGFAQRRASESVKQDIRQGTFYLTKENEPRTRQSRFNTWNSTTSSIDRNSLIDVSVASPLRVDGMGYKFAAVATRWWCLDVRCGRFFKTYVEQKQQAFRTCYAACASMHPQV